MGKIELLRKRILLHTLAHSVYKKRKDMQEWQEKRDEWAMDGMRCDRIYKKSRIVI